MKQTHLEQLKKYEDQWVALLKSTNDVVGHGDDALMAKENAKKRGYPDVILLKVLPFKVGYAPRA